MKTITLKNERVELSISDFGGEITSMKLDGFEYLWTADPKYFGRVSPIMFPMTGRFMDGYYMHNSQRYELPLNGLAMERTFTLVSLSNSKAKATLKYDDETLKIYPFKFELTVYYEIKDTSVLFDFEVTNHSDEIMPYSVGNHTAYKWPLIDGQRPESYYLKFEKTENLKSFNPFGWIDDYLINDNIRPIYHDLYSNFTRSFRDPKSSWIEYSGATCDYVVRTYRENFPFIANWTLPDENAKLVCIEPCVSISSHGPTLFDREGMRSLEPHQTVHVPYQLLLYKKSEVK